MMMYYNYINIYYIYIYIYATDTTIIIIYKKQKTNKDKFNEYICIYIEEKMETIYICKT